MHYIHEEQGILLLGSQVWIMFSYKMAIDFKCLESLLFNDEMVSCAVEGVIGI